MKYIKISKLKTSLAAGILVYYFLRVPLTHIGRTIYLLGILLYIWFVIEQWSLFYKKKETFTYFAISANILVELIVIYFVLHRLIFTHVDIFMNITLSIISLLICLLIVLDIARFIRKRTMKK